MRNPKNRNESSRKMRTSFLILGLSVLVLYTQTSCAPSKNPGANIAISVSPDVANIVPGKGSSCVALAKAKTDSKTPDTDISGDRVTYSRFYLQWQSPDRLTITSLKATVFSAGVQGATTDSGLEIALNEDEIRALTGLTALTIGYANPYTGADGNPRTDVVNAVDSTSTTNKPSIYEPCGIQLGNLTSVTGVTSYSARIRFEITGYGTTCDTKDQSGVCTGGQDYPVRKTVTVRAQKY